MFTITINFSDLSEKMEQYLEKEFAKLEKITGKPKEYHFKEALIRYMLGMEWDIRKQEIKKQEIKKNIKGVDKIIKEIWNREPHNHHFKEALVRYVEDMEDIRDCEEYDKRKKEGKVKYYTSEEANQRLKELRAKNA